MQYRRLGRTGLKVSSISLGSWLTFGSTVADTDAEAIVSASFSAGINMIDTADVYAMGKSEAALGRILQSRVRRHYVLASKCFWPMSDDQNDRGLSRKHITESLEASLERLRTGYLDLYQCHRFDPDSDLRETVHTMEDLVRRGKILYWGVSVWTGDQMREAMEIAKEIGGYGPASHQPQYSMLYRNIEKDALPATISLGMGNVIWSPMAQGMLTGKYTSADSAPAGSRLADERANRFLKAYMTPQNFAAVDKLRPIAQQVGCTMAQLALAWTLHQPGITSAIVGATRASQIAENAAAADITLSDAVLTKISEVIPEATQAEQV